MDADFAEGSAKFGDAGEPTMQEQDDLAADTMSLVLSILRTRAGALAWHSDSYPGRLALGASNDAAA
eukprot:10225011-Lingulodinium_polyedra.AAC.1